MTLSLSTKLVATLGGGSFNLNFLTPGTPSDPLAAWYHAHVTLNSSLAPIDPATDVSVQAVTAALGTDGTGGATLPGGSAGVRGWLRAILEKLSASVTVTGTFWQATQPISAASLPLPAGAATEASLLAVAKDSTVAKDSSLTTLHNDLVAVKNAIQAQIDIETLFLTDNGNPAKYYVRREAVNEGTGVISVVIENIDGSAPSPAPAISSLTPIASSAVTSTSTFFDVVTAATGYGLTDILARVVLTDVKSGAVTSTWQNVTQGTTLGAAPPTANVVEQTKNVVITATTLAPNAATAAKQDAIVTALAAVGVAAGENHIGEIGGNSAVATATFTRPANATAYAVGQLMANSTTAGSVAPMALAAARKAGGTGRIPRARLSSSNAGAANAVVNVHLYRTAPTTTVGDGGTFSGGTNGIAAIHLGTFQATLDRVFSDGAKGSGTPLVGSYITFDAATGSQNVYALLEIRSAYTPTSGETWTLALEVDRD